jgi:hypothetical protein
MRFTNPFAFLFLFFAITSTVVALPPPTNVMRSGESAGDIGKTIADSP